MVVQNNKRHLGEFLDHFDNIPKFPEKMEDSDIQLNHEDEYQIQLKSYKHEMDRKIAELKEMKYSNESKSYYHISDIIISGYGAETLSIPFYNFKNTRIDVKRESLKGCFCKKIDLCGILENSPFQIFNMIYQKHFFERNSIVPLIK